MAIKTNKSKYKEGKKSSSVLTESTPVKGKERPPSWSVDCIDNGYLITKNWVDKNGDYQTEKKFSETNPLDAA